MVNSRTPDQTQTKLPHRILRWFLRMSSISDLLIEPLCKLYEIEEVVPSHADCIVGLAGGLCSDGSASPVTRSVAERCVSLYLNGSAASIIFTGGYRATGNTEARAMAEIALKSGVPRERIVLEEESTRTHHHPSRVKPFLERINAKTVIIVSNHLHARRARAIFRRFYRNRFKMYFAKARSHFKLTPQRRYSCQTSCLLWNIGTHLLGKLKGWA